jgi:FlaA1/EpsC-like NDP-sugar epimerase
MIEVASYQAAFCARRNLMKYSRFAAMIATSTVVMFGLMYLNTYALDHVRFSETRLYMALLMGATMAVIMLAYMLGMYKNRRVNIGIFIGSVVVFVASLWLVRSQATIGDVAYMKAMIPHHSIAIMTSERANITDPRVRELADAIIETQREEIADMNRLIADLESNR